MVVSVSEGPSLADTCLGLRFKKRFHDIRFLEASTQTSIPLHNNVLFPWSQMIPGVLDSQKNIPTQGFDPSPVCWFLYYQIPRIHGSNLCQYVLTSMARRLPYNSNSLETSMIMGNSLDLWLLGKSINSGVNNNQSINLYSPSLDQHQANNMDPKFGFTLDWIPNIKPHCFLPWF